MKCKKNSKLNIECNKEKCKTCCQDEDGNLLRYKEIRKRDAAISSLSVVSDGKCFVCGLVSPNGSKLTIEHIYPKALKYKEIYGDFIESCYGNFKYCCTNCNNAKGDFQITSSTYKVIKEYHIRTDEYSYASPSGYVYKGKQNILRIYQNNTVDNVAMTRYEVYSELSLKALINIEKKTEYNIYRNTIKKLIEEKNEI